MGKADEASWSLYIIECDDGSLYTGVTNDLARRFEMHCNGQGAKYFRSCKPLRIAYTEERLTKSLAHSREYAVKQLTRSQKLQLIKEVPKPCSE